MTVQVVSTIALAASCLTGGSSDEVFLSQGAMSVQDGVVLLSNDSKRDSSTFAVLTVSSQSKWDAALQGVRARGVELSRAVDAVESMRESFREKFGSEMPEAITAIDGEALLLEWHSEARYLEIELRAGLVHWSYVDHKSGKSLEEEGGSGVSESLLSCASCFLAQTPISLVAS